MLVLTLPAFRGCAASPSIRGRADEAARSAEPEASKAFEHGGWASRSARVYHDEFGRERTREAVGVWTPAESAAIRAGLREQRAGVASPRRRGAWRRLARRAGPEVTRRNS